MSRLASFFRGFGRVLDINGAGTHIAYRQIVARRDLRTDSEKLADDMEKVADDMRSAIELYSSEIRYAKKEEHPNS